MDIINLSYNSNRNKHYIKLTQSSNSDAIDMYRDKIYTVQLSGISGSATVQYSLNLKDEVINDTALWHDWSLGAVSVTSGIAFDSPVTYIRVTTTGSYTLEVLSS